MKRKVILSALHCCTHKIPTVMENLEMSGKFESHGNIPRQVNSITSVCEFREALTELRDVEAESGFSWVMKRAYGGSESQIICRAAFRSFFSV